MSNLKMEIDTKIENAFEFEIKSKIDKLSSVVDSILPQIQGKIDL